MNVEVVEFYPDAPGANATTKNVTGTLHVYLVDEGIDLRGIRVNIREKKWNIALPSRWAADPETGGKAHYPLFAFTDKKKYDEMIAQIRLRGYEYIQKNYISKKKVKG